MRSFIILSRTPWDESPRARHQVANSLKKHGRVFFVEANKVGLPHLKQNEITPNFKILTPFFPLNSKLRYRLPLFNELFQIFLFFQLRKSTKNNGNIYFINFDHTFWLLAHLYKTTIYYCNDNHTRQTRNRIVNFYFKLTEKQVIQSSRLTISTSLFLKNKLTKFNDKSYYIPLGGPKPIHKTKVPNRSRINIALIGSVNSERIDLSVLNEIISDSSMDLHIWGNVAKEILNEFKKKQNVFFHAPLRGSELTLHLQNFDVGIAPYNFAGINLGGTPNKMWQYLAAGVPVVVTKLNSNFFTHPDHVLVSKEDNSDFVSLLHKAIKLNSDELLEERYQISNQNSWEKRVKELVEIIE